MRINLVIGRRGDSVRLYLQLLCSFLPALQLCTKGLLCSSSFCSHQSHVVLDVRPYSFVDRMIAFQQLCYLTTFPEPIDFVLEFSSFALCLSQEPFQLSGVTRCSGLDTKLLVSLESSPSEIHNFLSQRRIFLLQCSQIGAPDVSKGLLHRAG
jgi:hypothetical protein